MQEHKEYAGGIAPVKWSCQRMECRISTRSGALRLSGTVAEVMGWLREQCPSGASRAGGKMCKLAEVTQ